MEIYYIYINILERERGKKNIYVYINMDYKLRKLTSVDLLNLEKIYNYLELNPYCLRKSFENYRKNNNYHAKKIGALDQPEARGSTAGVVWKNGCFQISKLSKEHPILDDLLIDFMKVHNPEFNFNSVYITKNCQSKPHKDSGNPDSSIIVTVGKFEGGGLYVKENELTTTLFDIKKNSLEFDGRKHTHFTEEFTGTRYSLIFY